MIHVIYKQAEVILTAPWNLSHVDCEEVAAGGVNKPVGGRGASALGCLVALLKHKTQYYVLLYCDRLYYTVFHCIARYYMVLYGFVWRAGELPRSASSHFLYHTSKGPPRPPPARPSPFLDIWYFLRPPLALKIEFPHVGEFWSLRAKFVENSHP